MFEVFNYQTGCTLTKVHSEGIAEDIVQNNSSIPLDYEYIGKHRGPGQHREGV